MLFSNSDVSLITRYMYSICWLSAVRQKSFVAYSDYDSEISDDTTLNNLKGHFGLYETFLPHSRLSADYLVISDSC